MWKMIIRSSVGNSIASIGKDILRILIWVLLEIAFLIPILGLGMLIESVYGNAIGLNSLELMSQIAVSKTAVAAAMVVLLVSTGMTACFIRESPVRIPRMLFLLPTDEKTRMTYLRWKFFIRLLWLLGGIMLFHYLTLGDFFYERRGIPILVQLGIFLFTIWALILKAGIHGVKSNGSLEESRSLKELLVNFYWILFLLLQQIFFGIGYMFHIYSKYPAVWLIWLAVLALDMAAAKYCTSDVLRKAASYEQIYAKLS